MSLHPAVGGNVFPLKHQVMKMYLKMWMSLKQILFLKCILLMIIQWQYFSLDIFGGWERGETIFRINTRVQQIVQGNDLKTATSSWSFSLNQHTPTPTSPHPIPLSYNRKAKHIGKVTNVLGVNMSFSNDNKSFWNAIEWSCAFLPRC